MLVFMDIDGCLADCSHRLHYLKEKNYDRFYSDEEILRDTPILEGFELFNAFFQNWDVELVILTGRPYRTEDATKEWLRRQGYVPEKMIMRRNHDYRPSEIIKTEAIQKYIQDKEVRSILLIDDDPKNVVAVEKAVENCIGILFGTSRLDLK